MRTLVIVLLGLLMAQAPARADDSSATSDVPKDQVLQGMKSLWQNRKGHPYIADENNPNAVYAYPRSSKVEISTRLLGLCMAHELSRDHRSFDFNRSNVKCISPAGGKDVSHDPSVRKPSLVDYLSGTPDRSCDYASGHEEELKNWVLAQKDNSVSPVSIFAESLRLNGGEIFSSLITIHQLLRNNARWWDDTRYAYRSSKAEEQNFFDKMIDIRGDLKERGNGFHGDHFGSWFRIWGTMLYTLGFVSESEFHENLHKGAMCVINPLEGLEEIKLVEHLGISIVASWADEKSKLLQGHEEDPQKFLLDREGSETMTWMLEGLWEPESGSGAFSPDRCSDPSYFIH